MILTAGVPARLGVPTPDAPVPLDIVTEAGPQGSLDVSIARGTARWRGRLWDNEPFLVTLPTEPVPVRRRDATPPEPQARRPLFGSATR